MGYGNHAVDEDTLGLIEASFSELSETAKKRIVYRIFELQTPDDEQVIIGNYLVKSRNLARNLQGCEKVVLLGATLGAGVDLLLRRYALTEVARAAVMQACAAADLEEYLDEWQEGFKKKMAKEGWYLRPRFSPGYGDFFRSLPGADPSDAGRGKTNRTYYDGQLYADADQISNCADRSWQGEYPVRQRRL